MSPQHAGAGGKLGGNADAVVVGSGPNGLAAAITLARAGLAVTVVEGAGRAGGACRTEALTLEGFVHDTCAAVHPMAGASPFLRSVDLERHGVRLLHGAIPLAHPLGGERAAVVHRSLEATAEELGPDARWYRRLLDPPTGSWRAVTQAVLAPPHARWHTADVPEIGPPGRVLELAGAMARLARHGLTPSTWLMRQCAGDAAPALLAGAAAHSGLSLGAPGSAAYGMLLLTWAHAVGWPVVEGGSGQLTRALVEELSACGGDLQLERRVRSLSELPRCRAQLLEVTPRQLLDMASPDDLPPAYRRSLQRFRYGPGACKVDWALSAPVPWSAPACRQAVTLHVGGTAEEIVASEAAVHHGHVPPRPFVLVAQPSVVDPSRAPPGHHTLWAYCHVPNGSAVDMTERIEAQIERFAPGFRRLILARRTRRASEAAAHNPNQVGGDVNGGAADLLQAVLRPTWRRPAHRLAGKGRYLCSASTPPGGGVHGMCGALAAAAALGDAEHANGITAGREG